MKSKDLSTQDLEIQGYDDSATLVNEIQEFGNSGPL
jgi:hypothetical protein